jgi:hypothetical protein
MEPTDTDSDEWTTWSSLVLLSAFCLRPGVIEHLSPTNFLAWDGGYILVWRWAFKAATGIDIMDPELRSPTPRVSAARFDTLTRIFTTVAGRNPLPWRTCTSEKMSAFVRAHFPAAPKGFTLRPYGVRVAADVCAMALDLPEDLTNALFWWRRTVQSMRLYYGALSITRMYMFSEARTRLRCIHITPGRFDARITGPIPDFSSKAQLSSTATLPPAPTPVQLDAVWGHAGNTLATARLEGLCRVSLPPNVWQALPADAPAHDDDGDSDKSIDCDACEVRVSRYRRATLCDQDGCARGRCTACHKYNTAWRCTEHPPPRTRRRRD